MMGLAIWVGFASFRIEQLNVQAGLYLPRRDGGADGAWRVSRQNTPRDQLRGLVIGAGLLQYLFAPAVLGLAALHILRRDSAQRRWAAAFAGLVSLTALVLAFYRGYYSSLGW
jgi:hypothetical protein